MGVEELDMVWSNERRYVHAEWMHGGCMQQFTVTGVAKRLVVRYQVKRDLSDQPTKRRRMPLKRG